MPFYREAGEIPDNGCSRYRSPAEGGPAEDLTAEEGAWPGSPPRRRPGPSATRMARVGPPGGAAAAGLVPSHPHSIPRLTCRGAATWCSAGGRCSPMMTHRYRSWARPPQRSFTAIGPVTKQFPGITHQPGHGLRAALTRYRRR